MSDLDRALNRVFRGRKSSSGWLRCLVLILVMACFGESVLAVETLRFNRISIEQGLSQSTVNSMVQDRAGYLWIATDDGLNRYDGYGFRTYYHNPDSPKTLSNNTVEALLIDAQGRLWVGTASGLNRYVAERDEFERFFHDSERVDSLSRDNIRVLHLDKNGHIWIGTDGGGVNHFDPHTETFERIPYDVTDSSGTRSGQVYSILEDRSGKVWVGTAAGLQFRNSDTHEWRTIPFQGDGNITSGSAIRCLFEDSQGHIWIGTMNGGLNRLEPTTNHIQVFRHQLTNPNSLSGDDVRFVAEDSRGALWIGTNGGGLNLFDRKRQQFRVYRHDPFVDTSLGNDLLLSFFQDRGSIIWIGSVAGGLSKLDWRLQEMEHFSRNSKSTNGLSHNYIKGLREDSKGTLWIATYGGGLNRYLPKQNTHMVYTHDPGNPTSLAQDEVWGVAEDLDGNIWVGTHDKGLDRFDAASNSFVHYQHRAELETSLSNNRVRSLFCDRKGRLWIGTSDGLNLYRPEGNDFLRFGSDPNDPNTLSHQWIRAIHDDRAGHIWVATRQGGLNRLVPETGRVTHFRHDPSDPTTLSQDSLTSIYEDHRGFLWIGTYGVGLNRFDPETETFRCYRQADGLPNDVVYGVVEDKAGYLWLSTNGGLSRFDPMTESFKNYTVSDGLQGNEFSLGAHYRSSSGRLYFGGINGYNAFFPERLEENRHTPPIVINSFSKWSSEGRVDQVTGQFDQLVLTHEESVFSFEFAALDFAQPEENLFAYKMEGFRNDWTQLGNRHEMTFTNLDAGEYVFRVRGANNDGLWNETGVAVNIRIKPPWWQTWWAYLTYGLATLVAILAYVQSQKKKLAYERSVSERLRQVDRLKDEFLANTSHELRTPLNGIIGLSESLLDGAAGAVNRTMNHNLAMIISSARRLASLVNDILDFSKLRNHSLDLTRRAVDIRALTEVVFALSRPLLGKKRLQLVNAIPEVGVPVLADENRLQQIMHNLIGNAIKFTDEGQISVAATSDGDWVTVSVADTGLGIPKDKFEQIFFSFEQIDGSAERTYGGTGLGLAVTRQLVQLHGGRIWVESKLGGGSTFMFTLPSAGSAEMVTVDNPPLTRIMPSHQEELEPLTHISKSRSMALEQSEQSFRILIVDDEPVNRQVLVNHLSLHNYELQEAENGQQALDLIAEGETFDLILLDIMMPRLSGYEVCQKLRETHPVQELPIIFLTAKNQLNDLVMGFSTGANDYLTKPVTKNELLSRVKTHLQLLDVNRHLEKKVLERTEELNQKNLELGAKNEEILRTQKQLILQEKMASMGMLTAGIAHEIKNPLNFVHNFSELSIEIAEELGEAIEPYRELIDEKNFQFLAELYQDLAQNAHKIRDHGHRANQIVESMMELAKGVPGEHQHLQVNRLVEQFFNLAYHGRTNQEELIGVRVHRNLDETAGQAEVVAQNLSRVVINLVNNAIDSVLEKKRNAGSEYIPEVCVSTEDEGDWVSIRVKDNGLGIPKEHQEKIFLPFFSTKPTGDGHIGLGLAICYDIIVQEHQGQFLVDSEAGEYTQFSVRLPRKIDRKPVPVESTEVFQP